MNTQTAYDLWSSQYDTNENKTRDLERKALREVLNSYSFANVLEIGCGTGKNTQYLLEKADHITAVDLSEEMLEKAKAKIASEKVRFVQSDITQTWDYPTNAFNLITFSLVLEHIEHLDPVFRVASASLAPGGIVYIGELHPFKQYCGSKARFETDAGQLIVPCFNHHISDFTRAGKSSGLELILVDEYFDEEDRLSIPRILNLLFRKPV